MRRLLPLRLRESSRKFTPSPHSTMEGLFSRWSPSPSFMLQCSVFIVASFLIVHSSRPQPLPLILARKWGGICNLSVDPSLLCREAQSVVKNAGLSQEALESMGWPYEDLEALVLTLNNETSLRAILREHRLMEGEYDEEKESGEMRLRITKVPPPSARSRIRLQRILSTRHQSVSPSIPQHLSRLVPRRRSKLSSRSRRTTRTGSRWRGSSDSLSTGAETTT